MDPLVLKKKLIQVREEFNLLRTLTFLEFLPLFPLLLLKRKIPSDWKFMVKPWKSAIVWILSQTLQPRLEQH